MPLTFSTLLRADGIDPSDVSLIFHKTKLQPLRRMLPWIVHQRPDLFEAYQAVHSTPAERTLSRRKFCASFVPMDDNTMMLAGVFHIKSHDTLACSQIYSDPRYLELEESFGATDTGPTANLSRAATQVRFDLQPSESLSDLKGRLIVPTPPGRAYVRRADNLDPRIAEIRAVAQFEPACPGWRDLVLTGREVRNLPTSWQARLREWRGVYLIVDQSDGARYVGSAYGAENILGRWRNHVAQDVGVTKELKKRNPIDFQFSLLERISPDAPIKDVLSVERNWMFRIGTVEWGLNS